MPTKIELTLEQSQQGVSNDVLVSIEGVEELKRNVWIKGEKKEALLTLRQKPGQYIIYQNYSVNVDIEDDIMDPEDLRFELDNLSRKFFDYTCHQVSIYTINGKPEVIATLVQDVEKPYSSFIANCLISGLDDSVAALFQRSRIHKTTMLSQLSKAHVDQGSQIKMDSSARRMLNVTISRFQSQTIKVKIRSQSMVDKAITKQDKTITRQSITLIVMSSNVIGDKRSLKKETSTLGEIVSLIY
ncbi:hypothetical protein Tco_0952607 [Tanacetum coccineum]|uniref:Uncharacterized protein n=1 Tax=Tanacetum coccineum TaxID=301880 RepID=A0ABQ5DZT3_9ASTR